jgi:hypothetical protein
MPYAMGFVDGLFTHVPIVENIVVRVATLDEKNINVRYPNPQQAVKMRRVMAVAEMRGRDRCVSQWWSGRRTIARDAPSNTMSIIDHNTTMAARVRMTMRMKGNWSLRKTFILDQLLFFTHD